MCFYLTYKLFRIFYVTVYFYFVPFSAIIVGCIINIYFRDVSFVCDDGGGGN